MHLLAAQPGAILDGSEAVDLGQTPGEIIFLSAADTELATLAAAHAAAGADAPTLRLANLLALAHNLSVDRYVESLYKHRCSGSISYIDVLGSTGKSLGVARAAIEKYRRDNIEI